MTAHLAFPGITLEMIAQELARETIQRRQLCDARVASARMLPQERDAQLALLAAWAEDVTRIMACWQRQVIPPPAPKHGLTWLHRHGGLLAELDRRECFYPQRVADGRMLRDEAAHRVACIACLLEIYEDGWDWIASNGRRGNTVLAITDREEAMAATEYAAILSANAARKGTAQKELVL